MSPKPEVCLEFDLADIRFMRPKPPAGASSPYTGSMKDTMTVRDITWGNTPTVAIYVVLGGVNVIPISVPDDTTVKIEVTT